MNTFIIRPMTRGQITLPKQFRDKLGITNNTHLKLELTGSKITVEPLSEVNPYVIKPKYTRKEYKKVLDRISAHMKKHGPLWTKEDDRLREELKKKDEERAKQLEW